MKAYGKRHKDCANRRISGTTISCPCCTPKTALRKGKSFKHRARQDGKRMAVVVRERMQVAAGSRSCQWRKIPADTGS